MFERMCAELHLGAVGQLCPHTAWRLQGDALNLTLLNKLAQLLIGRTLCWLTRSTRLYIYQVGAHACHQEHCGTHVLGGSKGGKCVEGSHIGVNETAYTLFCVARGWWCHGSWVAA